MAKKRSEKQRRKHVEAILEPFRITSGKNFRLSKANAADTRGVKSKEHAKEF